jgi:ABC-type transport system substrate-binding protein
LRFEILVPATSVTRKNAAVALQEAWRKVGAQVSVAAVEFPVFQKRLAEGKFDAYIGAYLDEPSPRGLADQWTAAGSAS